MTKPDFVENLKLFMDLIYRPALKETEIDGVKTMVPDIMPLDKRVHFAFIALDVNLDQSEVGENEQILTGIILARMFQACPQCNGGGTDVQPLNIVRLCALCEGSGRVNGVTREKYLLSHLKGPQKTETFMVRA